MGGGLAIGFSLASSLFAAGSRTPGVVKEGPGGEGDDDDDEEMEDEEGDEEGGEAEEAEPMVETAEGGPAPWAPLECRSGSATTCKRGGRWGPIMDEKVSVRESKKGVTFPHPPPLPPAEGWNYPTFPLRCHPFRNLDPHSHPGPLVAIHPLGSTMPGVYVVGVGVGGGWGLTHLPFLSHSFAPTGPIPHRHRRRHRQSSPNPTAQRFPSHLSRTRRSMISRHTGVPWHRKLPPDREVGGPQPSLHPPSQLEPSKFQTHITPWKFPLCIHL